jgi:hypothetical protein
MRGIRWLASPRRLLAAGWLSALVGCSHVLTAAGPVTRPAGDEGALVYVVGDLSFQAPAAWKAEGDDRHVRLVAPGDEATVEAFASTWAGTEAECLADVEARLDRGSGTLTNVRRHPTTFAGRQGVTQEADQGPWHGWAWGACSGALQYRVWFAGRAPVSRDLLEVERVLVASARIAVPGPVGPAPGAGK